MAELKKRISELPDSGNVTAGLYTIGVNAQNASVKVPIGTYLDDVKTATQTANNAANTAITTANNAAAEAVSIANTAATTANTAADNADAATAAANAATTAANDAATAANTAKQNADTATAAANTAATNANNSATTANTAATAANTAADKVDNEIATLNDKITEAVNEVKSASINAQWYGIEFDTAVSTPTCTRIAGDMALHRTLPVHNLMRGCLLNDDGSVAQYLDPNDWRDFDRTGASGQVMVEIPEHYRKFETDGTKRRVKLSLYPLPGFDLVNTRYVSAYQATVDRGGNKLASVVNTDTNYRGGNNNAANDGKDGSLLGKPASNISLTNFRTYARNRGVAGLNGCGWNCMTYDVQKSLYWLFVVEYATLNSQAAFTEELTADGYKQGGLGDGVSNINGSYWDALNGYYPFIPCGYTDDLGNRTGVKAYTMPDLYNSNGVAVNPFEEDSAKAYAVGDYVTYGDKLYKCTAECTGSNLPTDTAHWVEVSRTITNVPRYRGVENPFAHIWQWTDGVNVRVNPNEAGGGNGLSEVFVCDDPSLFSSTGYDGYTFVGNMARSTGWCKEVLFGNGGEIVAKAIGGGSTSYHCDYLYANIPTTTTLRGLLFGGNASPGSHCGFVHANANDVPADASARIGSRLCFFPA